MKKNDRPRISIYYFSNKQLNSQQMHRLPKPNLHNTIRPTPRPTLQPHLRQSNNAIRILPHRIHNQPRLLGKRIPTQTRNTRTQNNTTPTQRTKKETPRNQHQRNDNNHPRPLN